MAAALTAPTTDDKPLTSYEELLLLFHDATKPAEEFRCGAEMEKFGVFADGRHVPYDGDSGVLAILAELATGAGWKP
jgi:gamma-glutamylcysteine synthetase